MGFHKAQSVLGPTLFSFYINDLPASSEYFTFKIFADDTKLFHTFPARENDLDMLQINRHLQDVVDWCKVNTLTINISKLTILYLEEDTEEWSGKWTVCLSSV